MIAANKTSSQENGPYRLKKTTISRPDANPAPTMALVIAKTADNSISVSPAFHSAYAE
ncbi:MAG: hypothetical protein IKH57_15875 [Clostridia bacterium]|nr:hypothetical protein [Clostridia bacterium]